MFVLLRGTQTWRLHTKLYKFMWNILSNNSSTECRTDLTLGQMPYLFILYTMSISWVHLWNGFHFFFNGVTVKTDNKVEFNSLPKCSISGHHGSLRARLNKFEIHLKSVCISFDAMLVRRLNWRCVINILSVGKTDKTSRTNLIYQTNLVRFRRRAIVKFNCLWDLALNSSELINFDCSATYKLGLRCFRLNGHFWVTTCDHFVPPTQQTAPLPGRFSFEWTNFCIFF